jgi:Cas7 group CRISPR-associated protein Csh2
MNRATGLLIIEVINSNPNGNPDQESDPRLRPDERGLISPVSFKRKLRDLVEDKEGPVWSEVSKSFQPVLDPKLFQILESRERDWDTVAKEAKANAFGARYWDGRIFGNTFLEKESSAHIRTGVVQFGLGVSISPVEVDRHTTTKKAGAEKDKDRGMAPLAYRIVQHGVYVMPYFVNPTAARKSDCTEVDIELMKRLIPHAYVHTASYIRPTVNIRHAWHIEHKSALGSYSDFALIEALTPKRATESEKNLPSKSWQDYVVPQALPAEMASKVGLVTDLVALALAATA